MGRYLVIIALLFIGTLTCAVAQFDGDGPRPAPVNNDYNGELRLPRRSEATWLQSLGSHWGYGFDSLQRDLFVWAKSPYVSIASLGKSVQNRDIWQLTITSPSQLVTARKTVFIHVRTHPGEVQAFRVANAIISYLTSENEYARLLRDRLVFYIVPMYNPDGVELELPRENAHNIDLERNWDDATTKEPEVAALRKRFVDLMNSPAPIQVALNFHSALQCKRYFVYHEASGTSDEYANIEQLFINGAQAGFPSGIEPWPFYQSWADSAPTNFPESWWWRNQGARVLALTYEDMNCAEAGSWDSTALSILHGIGDFLGMQRPTGVSAGSAPASLSIQALPNAFSKSTVLRVSVPQSEHAIISVSNALGRIMAQVWDAALPSGTTEITWDRQELADGTYYIMLSTGGILRTIPILLY